MAQIVVSNHGQFITSTNYWETPLEEAGKIFVSVNAGAIRVMVPRAMRRIIEDIRAAKYVILSRGPWPAEGKADAVELLFEDRSDSPFALHLSSESFDLLPAEPDASKEWVLSAWDLKKGVPHKAVERKCHWRRVPEIPWLKPL